MKCCDDCEIYVKRKCTELQDYSSDECKIYCTIFSTFINLSVFFPDAYEHMLKVWEISTENDLNPKKDYTENEHAL
jgi:hypothetical protein